jgi:hypothetical protein
MPQSGYTPLKIYSSSTPTNVPNASNLVNDTGGSELAINTYDEKLYFKNSSGVVKLLASVASTSGIYSSVTITGGTINGVTGTNSGMTVGNATNAVNATNATNATNVIASGTIASSVTATTQASSDNSTLVATTAFVKTTSLPKIATSGSWSAIPSGTKLYFNYNGTNVASLDSSGNFIALGNVTAFGTP